MAVGRDEVSEACRGGLGGLPPESGRERAPLLPVQRPGGHTLGHAGLRGRVKMPHLNRIRDRKERRGTGRVRDPHLGRLASPYRSVPAGRGFPAEFAAGMGKRCPGPPARKCTGWCVRCCPGRVPGRMSCRDGWSGRSYATSEILPPNRYRLRRQASGTPP